MNIRPCHIVLLALLALSGCGTRERLDATYGKTGGTPGGKSVNGTAVFAGMFKEAGHSVTTIDRFSPRLDNADTIVWFPDDFEPPSKEHREYLEQWLMEGNGRTVIYVGRDYDAAVAYWRKTAPLAPAEQTAEFQRNLAKAVTEFGSERMRLPKKDTYARWFTMKVGGARQNATTLGGPWASGIDPMKCEIELATKFDIPVKADVPAGDDQNLPDFEVLLSNGTDPLVTRSTYFTWHQGQVIVVPNGSFLLNLPLVSKENRKLAGRLIDECAASGEVVFVESGPGGPPIRKREEATPPKTGFEMLVVWPLGTILMHSIVCLFLACLCLYPIFGRPRKVGSGGVVETKSSSEGAQDYASGDFGKHLTALGELLSLTRDQQYALDKLQYYQKNVKRESGVSHVGPPEVTTASLAPQNKS